MINPWTKNPFLSMWLSGANAAWGSARGHATAEMHRQAAQMMAESTRQVMQFWTGALVPAASKRTRASGAKKQVRRRRTG